MTTVVRARRFAALALGQVAQDDGWQSIAERGPEAASLDRWLDTLHALAGKRSQQRLAWDAEGRLRLAVRARRGE
jgi:hypothetical protein